VTTHLLSSIIKISGGEVCTHNGESENYHLTVTSKVANQEGNVDIIVFNVKMKGIFQLFFVCYLIIFIAFSTFSGLIVGAVVDISDRKKFRDYSVDDALSQLKSELLTASEHRLSTANADDTTICQLSKDCLTINLLSGGLQSPVVFSPSGDANSRSSAFILYNYSRVSTLLLVAEALERKNLISEGMCGMYTHLKHAVRFFL